MNDQQPYESMPEGPKHAAQDWLATVVATLALVIGLAALTWPDRADASDWCSDWQAGYEYSYYLKCRSCQTIDPKACPVPEHAEQDGLLRGIKDGAADGVAKQRGMGE